MLNIQYRSKSIYVPQTCIRMHTDHWEYVIRSTCVHLNMHSACILGPLMWSPPPSTILGCLCNLMLCTVLGG